MNDKDAAKLLGQAPGIPVSAPGIPAVYVDDLKRAHALENNSPLVNEVRSSEYLKGYNSGYRAGYRKALKENARP